MSTDSLITESPADSLSEYSSAADLDHAEVQTFAALQTKSFAFALRIVKLQQYLTKQNEQIMSGQLLRCGTAIGKLAREAGQAEQRELRPKLALARTEAIETEYWLELLHQSGYINAKGFASIQPDIAELLTLLTHLLQTAKDPL